MQLIGNARIVDLLLGRELQNQRHQQPLRLHPPGGTLFHYLFEEDALVRHVLIDDPEPVAARGENKAFMDLPQRPQIRQPR